MAMFWIGLAVGVALTIPVIFLFSRRTVRRMEHLYERARAAERLAEIGTLTGGLAHEIKNPLSSVNLNIQLLQEDLQELADRVPEATDNADRIGRIQRRFESLARETQRLRDILEDFLQFAGRIKLDLAPGDVNSLIHELTDFFGPQASAMGVRVHAQTADALPPVELDMGLFKQALLNLMLNACQAMEQQVGGDSETSPRELIVRSISVPIKEGGGVQIHVTDTGPGIPNDAMDKLFQPYYSTKKGGTGLGLPTARRIIEEHGGTIRVHSELGRGTDFVIALPLKVGENAGEAAAE